MRTKESLYPAAKRNAIVISNDLDLAIYIKRLLVDKLRFDSLKTSTELDEGFAKEGTNFLILDRNDSTWIQKTVAQCLRTAPSTSIIICCKAEDLAQLETFYTHPNVEYVQKPVNSGELALRIRKLISLKKTRCELQDCMKFIHRISDISPELIYLFDVTDRNTIYVNRSFCQLVGCDPFGLKFGGTFYFESIVRQRELKRLREEQLAKIENTNCGSYFSQQYEVRDAEGKWRWLRIRETVFRMGHEGEPLQILGLGQEITVDKKA